MQRLQSELAALRAQLQSETARVGTAIDTSWTVGRERERELQAVLAAQKGRVMGINKQRDELNVFRRDVEAAQRAYDEVSKSAAGLILESRIAPGAALPLPGFTSPSGYGHGYQCGSRALAAMRRMIDRRSGSKALSRRGPRSHKARAFL
jgi:hypothetical protein